MLRRDRAYMNGNCINGNGFGRRVRACPSAALRAGLRAP